MLRSLPMFLLVAALGCAGAGAPAGGSAGGGEPAAAPAPLTLTGIDGETYDVDEAIAAGRNVVLAFWQTW